MKLIITKYTMILWRFYELCWKVNCWKGGCNIPDIGMSLELFWIIVAVACGILEIFSLGLTTIWFSLAALLAWLAAEFNLPFIVQLIVFLLAAAVLLYYTRPFVRNILKVGTTKTNIHSLIGKVGIVTVKINSLDGTGQVRVSGQIWSAKSNDDEEIEENEKVEILGVEGVKLIVKKVNEYVEGGNLA